MSLEPSKLEPCVCHPRVCCSSPKFHEIDLRPNSQMMIEIHMSNENKDICYIAYMANASFFLKQNNPQWFRCHDISGWMMLGVHEEGTYNLWKHNTYPLVNIQKNYGKSPFSMDNLLNPLFLWSSSIAILT